MTCSFSDPEHYREAIKSLPAPDQVAMDAARLRQGQLTKPPGSLGRLEAIAIWIAGWQGREKPQLNSPQCLIFAGNHGIAAQGVSAFPSEVTAQMVGNFSAGGAAINQLTRAGGINLDVIALELDRPTRDFTAQAAMTVQETLTAMQTGADAIPDDADILLLGEMGIANTTSAAAIALACLGGKAVDWVGPGTGLDADGINRKVEVVERSAGFHSNLKDGLSILSHLGGRELAAIAGAVLEARHRSIPVLLDGYISTASVLPLYKDNPGILDHCLISHRSQEPGHQRILAKTGLEPILDLGLRLGEGSGAATAFPVIRAAVEVHSGMATFAEAGVSEG